MIGEIRHGLASTFAIICPFCGKNNEVKTSGQRGPPAFNINTRVALGCLRAGIGQTHINNVLSTLNAQTLNCVTFKLREREVGKAVEGIAKSSCQDFLNMERKEALHNGVPLTWAGRNVERNNSRTGQAAVMSLSSGKGLD